MPAGQLENTQDFTDFINGCLFMGTGGGGDPAEGMKLLQTALSEGLTLRWVDADEIDDDALTVTVFGMGSIAPDDGSQAKLVDELGLERSAPGVETVQAVRALEQHLGKRVGCLVPVELGASNSPAPLLAAARLGIPVVDGDYAGRAIPDEMQTTPFIFGKPGTPFSSVDAWGTTAIVTAVANPYMLERVGKMLSIAGIDGCTMAATPLPGAEMKAIVVRNTLSQCLAIGRAARQAMEAGKDPIDAITAITGGARLFDGMITKKDWEDRDGYMFGTLDIEGTGRDEGRHLRIWLKNENHVTWLDGQPWVCSPDLISIVDPDTGRGFTNTAIDKGHAVSVVGTRGLDVFRDPSALDRATGPRYYGFDIDYRPMEDLLHRVSDHG